MQLRFRRTSSRSDRIDRSGAAVSARIDAAPEVPDADASGDDVGRRWNFEPGTEIYDGRTVFRALGGGSAYEVFLVWDEWLHALMVAKVLRPHRLDDERARRDMNREALVLERLAHPMIVRSFGADLSAEYPHILLEHLEGDTLRRLVKRYGRLSLEQLLPLALHVCSALQYLANQRLVHLDVKPANIVMSAPPRLIDLSIARSFDEAAALRVAIGTDGYMAPEQCVPGEGGTIGPPADVFGLGATLWHAASGTAPFRRDRGAGTSDDPAARWPQLVREPAPLPKDTPAHLVDVLRSMVAKDPSARPSANEVALALEPLVAELPTKIVVTRRGLRVR